MANRNIRIEDIAKIISCLIGIVGFLSVFRYINPIYSISFLALFCSTIYLDLKKSFFIPRWIFNTASLLIIAMYLTRINLDDLVVPTLESLLLLLAIKFFERKGFRDYMQIYMMVVFLLAGSALISLDMIFLVYFLVLVFLITTAIIMLTYYSQDPNMTLEKGVIFKILSKSLLVPFILIPLSAFMFLILPRTNYPLFDFLNRGGTATTGFTDIVRLGGVSDIQEDASVIFRAKMDKIEADSLYWRGIVLDRFDGVTWRPSDTESIIREQSIVTGERIYQEIYLEPYENKYLFGIDKPLFLSIPNMKKLEDLTFLYHKNIDRKMKYEVISIISDSQVDDNIDKDKYLQLPEREFKNIREFVEKLSKNKTKKETIKEILTFLKYGQYKYSLKNLPITSNPLEEFLFNYKYGNCEYFASAMAVMLRMAGIPSRLVGGYLGGYYNKTGGYYLVTQKNAHVWVEAYLDGRWIRLDPTPASSEAFVSQNDLLLNLRLLVDTINYYWNSLIISYDLERQFSIIKSIGAIRNAEMSILSKKDLIRYSPLFFFIVLLCVIFYYLLNKKSKEEIIISHFLNRLKRYGIERKESEGLEELVSRIKEDRIRGVSLKFVREFGARFYKDRRLTKKDIKLLNALIKEIKL